MKKVCAYLILIATLFSQQEDVTGNENGITQVKAIIEFLPNGHLHNTSQYLMHGNWVAGHEIYYKEDPYAKVLFK